MRKSSLTILFIVVLVAFSAVLISEATQTVPEARIVVFHDSDLQEPSRQKHISLLNELDLSPTAREGFDKAEVVFFEREQPWGIKEWTMWRGPDGHVITGVHYERK